MRIEGIRTDLHSFNPQCQQSAISSLLAAEVADGCDFHIVDEESSARPGDRIETRRADVRATCELNYHDAMIIVSRVVANNAKFVVVEVALKDDQPLLELFTIHVVA